MSRILWVADDDRRVPESACWWRTRIEANEDGNVAVTQYHMPEGKSWPEYEPWSGHIDYYDGRSDWSWPFGHLLHNNFDEMLKRHGAEYRIIYPTMWWMDVLDVTPPDVTESSQWMQVTYPGERLRPDPSYPRNGFSWPKARPDWIYNVVPAVPYW